MRLPMRHWVSIQNGSTAPVAFSSRESPFRMNKLKTFEHRTVYIYIYYVYIYIYTYEGTQNAIIIWNPLSIVGNRVEAVENQH